MARTQVDDWTLLAACRGMNDQLFPEARDQRRAKNICFGCPVRANCLAEALDNRIEWGVWGGMTERERRQLRRQRPDVSSWAQVLGTVTATGVPIIGGAAANQPRRLK
ncbi:MAG: WhiB family transcriptional regulator [Propionibacteriaceae bacterium]|jgi:WhiB family redox-sensing transcriptional regulator|nr:WhiB family transcriptional regulator [Propionibacteriaceae bacterium]